MSSMIPNPMTSPGPVGGTVAAPPTDDPNLVIPDAPAFSTPSGFMLPSRMDSMIQAGAPMGAFTDSQYMAEEAALRNDIANKYSDVLTQLGYQDPSTGAMVPGRAVQDANVQLAGMQRALQDAARRVTQNAQQTGTVFSGIRGQQLEQEQYPVRNQMGALSLDTTRGLSDIYNHAQGLAQSYNLQNNQLLASAAARRAAQLIQNPPAATGGTASGSAPTSAPAYGPGTIGGSDVLPPAPIAQVQPPSAAPLATGTIPSGGGFGNAIGMAAMPFSPVVTNNNLTALGVPLHMAPMASAPEPVSTIPSGGGFGNAIGMAAMPFSPSVINHPPSAPISLAMPTPIIPAVPYGSSAQRQRQAL